MKKWLLLVILVFLLSPMVYAQTVPSSELKSTLIDAIKDYLTSQTPKLEKDELKDLIVVYLTNSGDVVDLSGIGKFSGEKLIDIYNKAIGSSDCVSSGGKCMPNACSSYSDCSSLSVSCSSGYCCKGSCTALSGDFLIWGGTPIEITVAAGTEKVFLAKLDTDIKTFMRLDVYGKPEADASFTWTFPDGAVFPTSTTGNGIIIGDSVGGSMKLRSKKYQYGRPNIDYDYIPSGIHILRIKADHTSSLVIQLV